MKLIDIIKARKIMPLDIPDIDIQLKYKIVNFIKQTDKEEEFYNAELLNIITEFADKDENGMFKLTASGDIVINNETKSLFIERSNQLDNTEVQITDFSLTLDEVSQLKLSVRQMLDLDIFIKEK